MSSSFKRYALEIENVEKGEWNSGLEKQSIQTIGKQNDRRAGRHIYWKVNCNVIYRMYQAWENVTEKNRSDVIRPCGTNWDTWTSVWHTHATIKRRLIHYFDEIRMCVYVWTHTHANIYFIARHASDLVFIYIYSICRLLIFLCGFFFLFVFKM